MKRTYIKPEIELQEIYETTNLLAGSDLGGDVDDKEKENGRYQSKRHYNLWEDEDEEDW